jgi:hypothetical protein
MKLRSNDHLRLHHHLIISIFAFTIIINTSPSTSHHQKVTISKTIIATFIIIFGVIIITKTITIFATIFNIIYSFFPLFIPSPSSVKNSFA